MEAITIGIRRDRVVMFIRETKVGIGLAWDRAVELGQVVQRMARGALPPWGQSVGRLRVEMVGETELMLSGDGKTLAIMPSAAAIEIGNLLIAQGRRLEEQAEAERIIFDQALLQRRGMRLGLTRNPILQSEAGKEAAWNRTLRRALPGGVRGQEQFGTPAIIRGER